VLVDGFPVRNPRSLICPDARIELRAEADLRGAAKLAAALETFGIAAAGRVAVDVGAAAGGFTRTLLDAGARRVYAVDAGHGQLLGSLRQDERVVVLERTNLARLGTALIPEPVELVTIDVSYVSLATAVPQLANVCFSPRAELVALVKPMFELRLADAPRDDAALPGAVDAARAGIERAGWRVAGVTASPVTGARGAVEALLYARRGAVGTSGR
jgi:23S rRNA (cytidine1920-2'-O)/16S rRNA (cytidine1409-2'-O)-methyltransferase